MGGETYRRKGPHLAVRIKYEPHGYIDERSRRVDRHRDSSCLFCGMVRATEHTGTVWIAEDDSRIIKNASSFDQENSVKELATAPAKQDRSGAE